MLNLHNFSASIKRDNGKKKRSTNYTGNIQKKNGNITLISDFILKTYLISHFHEMLAKTKKIL
jgi:hypothetical protein